MGLRLSYFFLVLSILSACGRDHELTSDRIEHAYRLIDQGKHEQAIEELTPIAFEVGSDKAKEALSSAYAARAGVTIQNYWMFVASFTVPDLEFGNLNNRFIHLALDDLKKRNRLGDEPFIQFGRSIEPVLHSLTMVQEYSYQMGLLPVLAEWPNSDLDKAIEILGEVDTEKRSSYLYRSLLRMIQIKNLVVERVGQMSWKNETDQCRIDFSKFKVAMNELTTEVAALLTDLKLAYPSKHDEFDRHSEFVAQLQKSLIMVPWELHLKDFDREVIRAIAQLDKELWQCE